MPLLSSPASSGIFVSSMSAPNRGIPASIRAISKAFMPQTRLEIEQQFIGQTKHIEVAGHFAFGRYQGGVTTVAHAQSFDVIGDLAVQKADAIGASQANARTKAQVHDACGLGKRPILGQDV